MATKKKMLQAAAGNAAASGGGGAGGPLSVENVFSTYLYEGNGSSQIIENGINLGQSNDGGSGVFDPNVSTAMAVTLDGSNSGLNLGTGDFTFELFVYHTQDSGVANNSNWDIYYSQNQSSGSFWFGREAGSNVLKYKSTVQINGTQSIPLNAWAHIAIVRYNGVTRSYLDGVEQTSDSNTYTLDTNNNADVYIGNYYGGGYGTNGRISNFRIIKGTAVYTSNNFTVPTSPLTDISGTVFLGFQDEGPFVDNSSNAITVSDNGYGGVSASTFGPFDAAEAGEGGLVWTKNRSGTNPHQLYDTERGVTKRLKSDSTDPEQTAGTGLVSFNSSGYSISSATSLNTNGNDFASWTFRKAPKFFDVVSWTGDGTNPRNISHNLGSVPGCFIVKCTSGTTDWRVYHRGLSSPEANNLFLHNTNAVSGTSHWSNTAPTDTHFTVSNHANVNASGSTYVAYLFAHNDGDGEFGPDGDADIIKCGSYTTDANEDATIDLGWEPQWLLVKRIDGAGGAASYDWRVIDNLREWDADGDVSYLAANEATAEASFDGRYYLTSTGFKQDNLGASRDYIYIAIRRGPMAVPTDATDVFAIDESSDNIPMMYAGFPPDLSLLYTTGANDKFLTTRLLGDGQVRAGTTAARTSQAEFSSEFTGAFSWSPYLSNYYAAMWKRAPNFFDAVAYTGNGTAGRTVSHNLGVVPEMMWVKCLTNTYSWSVYHKGCNGGVNPEQYRLVLSDTFAESANSTRWNDTAPTDSVFTLGSATQGNGSGEDYIAYLFASLDGVSKVGSYTGNGTSQNIDCGFSSGARLVFIKRTDSTGDWGFVDTERGIVAGTDSILYLNDGASELTGYDVVDPYSSGFTVTSSYNNWNASGGNYIFYAIA